MVRCLATYASTTSSASLNDNIDVNQKVSSLIIQGTNQWNIEALNGSMEPEDVEIVFKINLTQANNQDLLGWHYTNSGIYTVRSGNWLRMHLNVNDVEPPPGSLELKKAVWKNNIGPKIKHLCWHLLSGAVLAGTILQQRRVTNDTICKRCCADDETLDHLFFTCPYAQSVWRLTWFQFPDIVGIQNGLEIKLKAILDNVNNHQLSSFHRQLPLWMLWQLWKSRNLLVYGLKQSSCQMDYKLAREEAKEWAAVL